ELDFVRSWPMSLLDEPEAALSAFAPRFSELIQKADAALVQQGAATSARADFRVRVIHPFVDRANDARFQLYAQLANRAQELKLGKHWPDEFFKTRSKRRASRSDVTEASEAIAPGTVAPTGTE
ncbi:MAG TPA: hypothetical protein DFS52_21045, partial [Myxococcales bacterium]|nr:hypothetical protein [Myxococcales bacterium]